MIVDCAVYEQGRRQSRELSLEDVQGAGEGAFVWLDLEEPTPQELEYVRREFGLEGIDLTKTARPHGRAL
jgi:Mg2+ and Co2+ transporter CorA